MTRVVAALIWKRDRFLICQRPAYKERALLWEFAGGKVEPGESEEQALVREVQEELGVRIEVGAKYMQVVHTYPDLTVHLALFHARITAGKPHLFEHQDLRWIRVEEIGEYDFCPADTAFLLALERDGIMARFE